MTNNTIANLDLKNESVGWSGTGGTTKRKLTSKGSGDIALIAQTNCDVTLPNRSSDTLLGYKAFSAKGGILVGTGSGTFQELAVGSDGQYLGADSSQTTGLKWNTISTGTPSVTTFDVFDDFIACTDFVTIGGYNWECSPYFFSQATTTSDATILSETTTSPTSTSNPGVLILTSGTNTNWSKIFTKDNISFGIGSGQTLFETLVRVSALSTTPQQFYLYAGWSNQLEATNAEPTNGAYFYYTHTTNSGNWTIKTANGGTRSSANTGTAVAANTWYKLKIIVNAAGTSASFYINDVEVTGSPIATNIPTANAFGSMLMIDKIAGTTTISYRTDYVWRQYTTASR